MDRFRSLIKLCRPEQYYKNLVVFLAIFFSGHMIFADELLLAAIGFISLSLMSSTNYIINDIFDRKRDIYNKEKARPLIKGEISVISAAAVSILLFILSLVMAYFLNTNFLLAVISFFTISFLYSSLLKNEPFLDIIIISINFVIRAIAGALLIEVWISPWLIIGTFFLAFFLVTGKRKAEMVFLGKKAVKHKPVLAFYSDKLLDTLVQISTTTLLISYSLYVFLGVNKMLLLTLPIALYIVLRYISFIYGNSEKARTPNKALTDMRMAIAIIIYLALSFILLYYPRFTLS